MLSKKMAFSLMSLITLLAFAFAVPSAMAGDFGTAITIGATERDVSHADGIQLEIATSLTLNVKFDQVVALAALQAQVDTEIFAAAGVKVQGFTEDGALTPAPNGTAIGIAAPANGTPADGKNFTVALSNIPTNTYKLIVRIEKAAVGAALASVGDADDSNAAGELVLTYLGENRDPVTTRPMVYKIARVGEPFTKITSADFMIHVLLSEDPKGGLVADLVDVGDNATVSSVLKLATPAMSPALPAVDINGDGNTTGTNEQAVAAGALSGTWRDGDLHLYLVTITTKPGEKTFAIRIKNFAGNELPAPGTAQEMYIRGADNTLPEGRQKLMVTTNVADPKPDLKAGIRVSLGKDIVIPAGGYLIVAEDAGASQIIAPATGNDKTPDATLDPPAQLTYKLIGAGAIPNLETLLNSGGVIDVEGPPALVISEIMWGSDASLDDPADSQWIELYNAGAEYKTVDNDAATDANEAVTLVFYGPADTLPAIADVNDRVGTIDVNGAPWSVGGIGQSGRTGTGEKGPDIVATVPTERVISMQRAIATDGTVSDGQDASSWTQSAPPGLNFKADAVGIRVANPGTGSFTFADPVVDVEDEEVTVLVAMPGDIMITEIMVDTGNGRLPQWIELTNVSGKAASLAGWSLQITNSDADDDVIGGLVSINLSGTLGVGGGEDAGGTMGKSLLLVAGEGRSSSNLDGSDRVVNISSQLDQRGRYTLMSTMAFMAALVPPQTTGVLEYGDVAGNLDEGWELPASEGARSSLIRREADALGMATMGTMANGWVLASDTPLVSGPATWYGSDEDAGTPGYDAGGPLPVQLSHFRPARDRDTGAAVITWSTQSELNNAGFFIKRSQQRDGQFKVINAAMIQGAGTISEKQFYTYTDTTAQPNVVYYYQIEDVSLDGNRQTLTNGIRLKGHIGAAGKLTTMWGDLKTSQ